MHLQQVTISNYKSFFEPKVFDMDLTRFNRHLIRSKLKRRKSHEGRQLHSPIQG